MRGCIMQNADSSLSTNFSKFGLIAGIILFLAVLNFTNLDPQNPQVTRMAAVALLMATWWISDAIPLYATALLPVILFPLLGILESKSTAAVYFNSIIFLFLGGFMIALTMEKWNLHKRIALFIIRFIGGGPARITLGFMLAAALLSMLISNTATAIMMLPIGMAIINQMESKFSRQESRKFSVGLMLAIAYACSLGGVATLVGTPPNLSFVRIFEITFPNAPPITFGTWFVMAFPLTVIMLAVVWFLITKVIYRVPAQIKVDKSVVDNEYRQLGKISFEEKVILAVFISTAVLWVFRLDLVIGVITVPGWSRLLPYRELIDDATVAMSMALLLFLVPARDRQNGPSSIMSADVIKKLPWGIVVLFGGGFALARGFQTSGLSELIGAQFAGMTGLHPFVLIIACAFVLTFLTELTSNTATTQMILPILASVAVSMQINPLLLMVPATLSSSFAFMMPVATPPNAIVFGSGHIKISDMARAGVILNLLGVIIITLLFYYYGSLVLDIDPAVFPEWAR